MRSYENYGEKMMALVAQCYQDICDMLNEKVGVGGVVVFADALETTSRTIEADVTIDNPLIMKVRLVSGSEFEYQLGNDDYWNDDFFDSYPSDIFDLYDSLYYKLNGE